MVHKKGRKLAAGAIAGSMLLLSACGSTASTDKAGSSGTSSPASSGNQHAAATSKTVTLQVWLPVNIPEIEPAIKQVGADFEKTHPNIKVEITTIPFPDFFQKLSVAYGGGIQPDVHGLGFGQLISTVDQGNYMDLTQFVQKDNWSGKDDFFPDILKAGQWNGGLYGLLIPETRPLVWRKDYFREAGLDPNKPPQTYDELLEYAKKLAKKDSSGKVVRSGLDLTTSGNGSEQSFLSMLLLNGLNYYDEKGNPTFDSAGSAKVLSQLTDLVKDKDVVLTADADVTGTLFQNNLAAMGFQSSFSLGQLTQSIGKDKIGYALPPKGPNGAQTSLMLGTFMTMAKKTAHPQEAWEFMKFMFSPDEIYQFTKTTGYLPPLKSLKAKFESLGEANKVIFATMNSSGGYLPSSNWNVITKYLRIGLEESYYGKKTPENTLKENADKARQELAKK